jgi:hypothetical protein
VKGAFVGSENRLTWREQVESIFDSHIKSSKELRVWSFRVTIAGSLLGSAALLMSSDSAVSTAFKHARSRPRRRRRLLFFAKVVQRTRKQILPEAGNSRSLLIDGRQVPSLLMKGLECGFHERTEFNDTHVEMLCKYFNSRAALGQLFMSRYMEF